MERRTFAKILGISCLGLFLPFAETRQEQVVQNLNGLKIIRLSSSLSILNEEELFDGAEAVFHVPSSVDCQRMTAIAWLDMEDALRFADQSGRGMFYGEVKIQRYSHNDVWSWTTAIEKTEASLTLATNSNDPETLYYYVQQNH